mgnify:FL=1
MLKDVKGAVFRAVREIKEGTWQPGERTLGVKEGGLDVSPMRFTRDAVPASVFQRLDTVREMIGNGTLTVPATESDLQAFVPPRL